MKVINPMLVRDLRKKLIPYHTKSWENAELINAIDLAIRRGAETRSQIIKEAINFLYA